MAKELFGTDGIRGVAGEAPLDPATVYALGVSLGQEAASAHPAPEVVIGVDTRESGTWLAGLVAAGLAAGGARVRFAGVITTPAIAYLTRTGPFAAGVMISASHNPYRDNGIKVFDHSGFKLPDAEEHRMEQAIFRLREIVAAPRPLALEADPALDRDYLASLESTVAVRFDGLHVALDCGNGAAYRLGPELFTRLGARVTAFAAEPNGQNINLNCGATHVEPLRHVVIEARADCGVAFDGDADRAIFVSSRGKILNGDAMLLAAARALRARGKLPGDLVVATVMSNLGLEQALAAGGIRMLRTPVGDKYVLEEMVRTGAVLGGEQSGHVIFREHATTGDGLLTALKVLEISQSFQYDLELMTADLEIYPQKLVNVRVREKKELTELPAVAREIRAAEAAFAGAGRVLVRFSGTEPLARVMVEGPDPERVEQFTESIAAAIRKEMGA
ncbi:MAG: phosphoglucosamine mutase [Bryobacteraceae bacterium]